MSFMRFAISSYLFSFVERTTLFASSSSSLNCKRVSHYISARLLESSESVYSFLFAFTVKAVVGGL